MAKTLIIVTHGETRGAVRNRALKRLTKIVKNDSRLGALNVQNVFCAVLNGEPALKDVLEQVQQTKTKIVIYPLFMSTGYFVKTAMPKVINEVIPQGHVTILPTLSEDPGLPKLIYQKILETLSTTYWGSAQTRLMLVGHGSTKSPVSAQSTKMQAEKIKSFSRFASLETTFLEEAPFFEERLIQTANTPTIIAGYFTGSGLHGNNDVYAALEKTKAKAVYTGPIGSSPQISDLIIESLGHPQK